MNNSNRAAAPQPKPVVQTPAPSAPTVQTPPPAEAPAKQASETVSHATLSTQELLAQLNDCSGNKELWYLTYMLHNSSFFRLRKDQSIANHIRLQFNGICANKTPQSRLEDCSKCAAYQQSGYDYYRFNCKIKDSAPYKSKCSDCTDDIPFCIPRMNAYIDFHCKANGIDPEEIYRSILGSDFRPRAPKPQERDYRIPAEEYEFLDSSCTIAAAELIKMDWIRLKESNDQRISYVYLPLCERTSRSFIQPALDFYRNQSGKHDFIRADKIREELCDNRQCPNCMFSQCPDKVAGYILALARKYGVEPLELVQYIVKSNMIHGVTVRGNFRYYETLRKLEAISFTDESRMQFQKILKYIVNNCARSGKQCPTLPFHLVLFTKDEQLADEAASIFHDAVWYYAYLKDCSSLTEYRMSQGGLSGLIEFIEKLEKPTVLHIKEMNLLNNEEAVHQNHMQMTRLNNLVQSKQSQLFVVVSGEKSKLDTALGAFSDFYHGTLQYHLTISDMPTARILDSILEILQKDYTLEDGFSQELEYYVISQYAESPLRSKAFIDFVVQTILFNHFSKDFASGDVLRIRDIPMAVNRRSDEEIWQDLNELTGLENVRDEVHTLEQLIKFQKKMQNLGVGHVQKPNLHMVFTGNPGTGKTTVARLIAELLYNVGYIRQNKLVEASPKDLIGQYIGQTAPKTAAICESAYDGVLFIDEAYELTVHNDGHNNNFRSECITELIKQMEDNRDKLVVIFAGYTQQMQQLLDSNPGFASRIGKIIPFEDYSTEQLLDMYVRLVRKNGLHLQDSAQEAVSNAIRNAKEMPHFGNARYVRNLYEKTLQQHAKNTVFSDDPTVLTQISVQDIPKN